MNNSVNGKTIEPKRRRLKVEITRKAESAGRIVSKFEFERFKVFEENKAAMSSKSKIINWNTPTIFVGGRLDLAKIYMYRIYMYNFFMYNKCCCKRARPNKNLHVQIPLLCCGLNSPVDCYTQIRTVCFTRWSETISITNWKSKPRMWKMNSTFSHTLMVMHSIMIQISAKSWYLKMTLVGILLRNSSASNSKRIL